MPKTLINCPNCRQPIEADVQQLFDAGVDLAAKQKLLSGAFNIVECPHCRFQGNIATPLVYHDPQKDLLLTFIPPEVNMPRDEQEKAIGAMIKQVMDNLPQEKRKAYLFNPQSALTMQGFVERILEADGITREMIQAQQERLKIIQRLLSASEDVQSEIMKQEDGQIDAEFFSLLASLMESSRLSGDDEAHNQLTELQKSLLKGTTFGRQLEAEGKEVQAAIESLQEAGQELTREKLLDIVVNAPSDARVRALVSLARPGMDYEFFLLLSQRIDRARGDGRRRLIELREQLIELTAEIDRQNEVRAKQAHELLDRVLQADDVEKTFVQVLPAVDEFFLQQLSSARETAEKQGDTEKIEKIEKIMGMLEQLSEAPPEIELIEELLQAPDDQTLQELMKEHEDKITPEFMSALANVVTQIDDGEDKELAERMRNIHRAVLRFSMAAQMSK